MRKRCYLFLSLILINVNAFAQANATDSILRYWLQPQIVNNDLPVANTFYFWTTSAELDSCVTQKRLLRTSVSENYYESMYIEQLLLLNEKSNQPITNHLLSGDRQRIREGWPCYWTAMHPFYQDSLENQLVQVVLMDSSLIVSFFPDGKKSEMWKVHDLKGNELSIEQTLLRKRHIAAVFVSGDDKLIFTGPRRTVFRTHYRSFILCNEDMIKSWHHNVPGLQAKLLGDLNYLILLNAWFENPEHCAEQGNKGKVCYAAWKQSSVAMKISDLFFAAQRRAGYLSDPANQTSMMEIIDKLRKDIRLQKYSYERFPGKNPVYIPKRDN